MNENIITWNVTNWVTVILMAAIGFFLIGTFLKWKQQRNRTVADDSTQTAVAEATSLA